MSAASTQLPGLRFKAARPAPDPSPLRSDVAGFLGRTRRGAPGALVRVEGWRGFLREFGGLDASCVTPYAVRGYFDNGGQVAYVVRLAGRRTGTAAALLDLKAPGGRALADPPAGFRRTAYEVVASSPGRWARGARVHARYRRRGAGGAPELDLVAQADGEPVEYLIGLDPAGVEENSLEAQVARRSRLVRLRPAGEELADPGANTSGPLQAAWSLALALPAADDAEEPPTKYEYLDALDPAPGTLPRPGETPHGDLAREWAMGDEREVAVVCAPDLHTDVSDVGDRAELLSRLVAQAEGSRDRLVLVDLPEEVSGGSTRDADRAAEWVENFRALHPDTRVLRAAAVYHPRVKVLDPLGGILRPLKSVPPSGHVAGVISRLDRERGAHHTPANAVVFEAIDLGATFDEAAQGFLNSHGLNLLRCSPGRGIQVWGGRTLDPAETGRFVAHRRLVHRLVRAIRRVAEPLVFETNGPELWLTFFRAVTTVLLEAYRGGGLKGARPEDAFRVRCDERTNPPEEVERGRLVCEIMLAPAAPMEFITLRIAMSADATLEVIEE